MFNIKEDFYLLHMLHDGGIIQLCDGRVRIWIFCYYYLMQQEQVVLVNISLVNYCRNQTIWLYMSSYINRGYATPAVFPHHDCCTY